MQAATFSVLRWSAWAPGLDNAAAWRRWAGGERLPCADETARPRVDFLPPLLRRRLSSLSRAALAAAYECAAGEHGWRTIFASPHGEIHRTVELLGSLADSEPLSPNGFSLSVHNTASGLYAIASGNRAPSSAVAAGRDTLAMALIDAAGWLARGEQRVLLVFGDEPLPAFYQPWQAPAIQPFALALLLAPAGSGGTGLALERLPGAGAGATADAALMPLLTGVATEAEQAGERCRWRWVRS